MSGRDRGLRRNFGVVSSQEQQEIAARRKRIADAMSTPDKTIHVQGGTGISPDDKTRRTMSPERWEKLQIEKGRFSDR